MVGKNTSQNVQKPGSYWARPRRQSARPRVWSPWFKNLLKMPKSYSISTTIQSVIIQFKQKKNTELERNDKSYN